MTTPRLHDDEADDRDDTMTRQVTITMTECEASWLAGLVARTTFGSLTGNIWEAQMLDRALRAIRAAQRREQDRRGRE